MAAEMEIDSKGFDLLVEAASSAAPVEALIVTTDKKVEDYWGVTEFGSREGHRPWPTPRKKTTRSGGRVFSKQAVGGWIYKYGKRFVDMLQKAYEAEASRSGGVPSQANLAAAANEAGKQVLDFVRKTAPVDEGTLRDSLSLREAR